MNENLKLVFPFSGPRKEQKLRTRTRQPLVQQFLVWLGNPSRPTKKDATKKEWRVVVLKQRPNTQCRTIGRTGYVSLFFQRRVLEYSVVQNFCQFQFDYFKSAMQLYSSFKFPAFMRSKLHSLFSRVDRQINRF